MSSASGTARHRASTARVTCSGTATSWAPTHTAVCSCSRATTRCRSRRRSRRRASTSLAAVGMPVLSPGRRRRSSTSALHAIAMSRWSGLWVGMKIVANVADGFGTARSGSTASSPCRPASVVDGRPWTYRQGGLALPPRNLGDERDLLYGRTEAARAYAGANAVNVITHSGGVRPRLGIVAAGKTYHERPAVAARRSGSDDDALAEAGVRVLRLGMISPLEPDVLRDVRRGARRDPRRRGEALVRRAAGARPPLRCPGTSTRGRQARRARAHRSCPADGELTADRVTPILASRLAVGTPPADRRLGHGVERAGRRHERDRRARRTSAVGARTTGRRTCPKARSQVAASDATRWRPRWAAARSR